MDTHMCEVYPEPRTKASMTRWQQTSCRCLELCSRRFCSDEGCSQHCCSILFHRVGPKGEFLDQGIAKRISAEPPHRHPSGGEPRRHKRGLKNVPEKWPRSLLRSYLHNYPSVLAGRSCLSQSEGGGVHSRCG